eukprot:g5416.t1
MVSFVLAHGTAWASVWPSLPGIVRSDAFRYLHAWHAGGVYADSDCWCVRPCPAGAPLVVGVESAVAGAREARRVPAMASALVSLARALPAPSPLPDAWVLDASGPFAFTRACRRQPRKLVLPKCAFAATGYPSPSPGWKPTPRTRC